jgi:hypothetical protein
MSEEIIKTAARGFVENHHLWLHGEPFGEDDLLLVAARE